MAVTVQDCLSLNSLSDAIVVGGAGGLQRIVKRASVLEFATFDEILADASARGGDAIISALFSVAESVEQQCKTMRVLNKNGESCLILFYVGTIVKEVSDALIQTADELDFPLIVMPRNTDVIYSDIIFDMTSLLLEKQSTSLNINEMIFEISQNDINDLSRAMNIIAKKIGGILIIADSFYQPLLVTCSPQAEGLIPLSSWDEIIQELKRKDVPASDSGYFFKFEIGNKNTNVFFSDIKSESGIIHLLIFDFSNSLNCADLSAIASMIGICVVIWKYHGDTDENNLVQALLSDNGTQAQFALSKYHLKPDSITNLLILSGLESDNASLIKKDGEIQQLFARFQIEYFTAAKDSYIVYLPYKTSVHPNDFEQFIEAARSLFEDSTNRKVIALLALNLRDISNVNDIYMVFREACHILRVIFPEQYIFDQYSLEFSYSCLELFNYNHRKRKICMNFLAPLDAQSSDALVDTLAVYVLDASRNVSMTARLMFIHANTVQYRLKRVKELLNIDLNDVSETILLTQSLAIYRMLQHI